MQMISLHHGKSREGLHISGIWVKMFVRRMTVAGGRWQGRVRVEAEGKEKGKELAESPTALVPAASSGRTGRRTRKDKAMTGSPVGSRLPFLLG